MICIRAIGNREGCLSKSVERVGESVIKTSHGDQFAQPDKRKKDAGDSVVVRRKRTVSNGESPGTSGISGKYFLQLRRSDPAVVEPSHSLLRSSDQGVHPRPYSQFKTHAPVEVALLIVSSPDVPLAICAPISGCDSREKPSLF